MALGDRVPDEGVRRLQIQDVVLVDARRDDHQRALVDLLGRRRVLDELDQLVLEHDGARRRADVAAHLERRLVRHRDPALGQVLGEQAHALQQARPTGLHRELQRLGVGGERVGRAQRVHDLLQREPPLRLAALVDRCGGERLAHEVGLREVGPGDGLVARVLRPRVAREAPVLDRLGRGRDTGHQRCPGRGERLQRLELQRRDLGDGLGPRGCRGGHRLRGVRDVQARPHHVLGGHQLGEPAGRVRCRLGHRRSKAAGSACRSCSATPAGA